MSKSSSEDDDLSFINELNTSTSAQPLSDTHNISSQQLISNTHPIDINTKNKTKNKTTENVNIDKYNSLSNND